MIILTDADGVLENLTHVWVELLNEKYGYSVKYEDVKEWDMCKSYPGLTREEVYGMELNDELYDRMGPMEGGPECIRKLIEKGHEVYVVTNTPYQVIKSKMEKVIFKYYPFLTWKNVIVASNKKLIKGDVLIDDGIHNLMGGDYKKILFTAPYNEDFDAKANDMIRVSNWSDIEKVFEKLGI